MTTVIEAHDRLDRATEACIRARYLSNEIVAEYGDAGHAYFAALQREDFGNADRTHNRHYTECRPAIFERVQRELVESGTIRVMSDGAWLYLAEV